MDHNRLITDLITDEGFISYAYKDSEGYLTIGIGRMVDKRLGGGISRDEAMLLLRHDIADICKELDEKASWWRGLPDRGQEAFVNMAFNLGWPRLSKFENMIDALKAGDYPTAANEALNSKWAKQVGTRARRIADIFRSLAHGA